MTGEERQFDSLRKEITKVGGVGTYLDAASDSNITLFI